MNIVNLIDLFVRMGGLNRASCIRVYIYSCRENNQRWRKEGGTEMMIGDGRKGIGNEESVGIEIKIK